jgi:RimJ/RimL family protein N-acetyltransferase
MDKPSLEGEMIRLRPLRADDAPAMWEMVTDPASMRLTGTRVPLTRDEVERWCATVSAAPGRIDLAITANGSDEYLGEIVLEGIDESIGRADLRLVMRPAYRGRGYGTEAIQLVLGLAYDGIGLHRVGLEVLSLNNRAHSMYENIGFSVEGRRRDAFRDGDGWCDGILMGMLEDEFRTAQTD